MVYNDFPILNDTDYNLINQQYSLNSFNRKDETNILYLSIEECCFACFNINTKLNENIKNQIIKCRTCLEQIMENLNANFKIEKIKQKTINNLNIFGFINKLIAIFNLTNSWLAKEEKEYYKKLIKNINNTILYAIKNILSALEKSNFILFTHM